MCHWTVFGPFSAIVAIATTFASSRCAGWTDSRLRTSILRPPTHFFRCYTFFSDNNVTSCNVILCHVMSCMCLRLTVCMCVCVCTCICAYVRMCVYAYVRTCVCVCVCVYMSVYVWVCVRMYVCMFICRMSYVVFSM